MPRPRQAPDRSGPALPHPSLLLPSTKVPTSSSWTSLESLKEQHKVGAGQAGGGRVGTLSLSVEMEGVS